MGGGMFGQPPVVARNIITLQLILDPLSPQGLEAVTAVLQAFAGSLPIRAGAYFRIPSLEERAHNRARGQELAEVEFDDMSVHEQFVRCGSAFIALRFGNLRTGVSIAYLNRSFRYFLSTLQ